MVKKWGLSFLINTAKTPEGRSPGSLAWAGLANTYFWIDPARDVTGVILMQVLPFADEKCLEAFAGFERGVYAGLDAAAARRRREFDLDLKARCPPQPQIVIPRACGGSSTPRLLDLITDVSGILGRPPEPVIGRPSADPLADDDSGGRGAYIVREHTFAFPRRDPPEFCKNFRAIEIRGRGECRMRDAPAASRAEKEHAS